MNEKALIKAEQKVARLERHLALEKIKSRKLETRRKIEMGGLVIKAKMDRYSKAVILGALIDAAQHLENDDALKSLMHTKGSAAFMEFDKESTLI